MILLLHTHILLSRSSRCRWYNRTEHNSGLFLCSGPTPSTGRFFAFRYFLFFISFANTMTSTIKVQQCRPKRSTRPLSRRCCLGAGTVMPPPATVVSARHEGLQCTRVRKLAYLNPVIDHAICGLSEFIRKVGASE